MNSAHTLKNIFCDRDGTIIYDKHYLADPAGVELLPGAAEGMARLADAGMRLFLVSNQSGIGRGMFGEADYAACHARLKELLAASGVELSGSAYCPHAPQAEGGCDCRKPGIGMWRALSAEYAAGHAEYAGHAGYAGHTGHGGSGLAADESAMIGDKPEDLLFAVNAGFAAAVLVLTGKGQESAARLGLPKLAPDEAYRLLDVKYLTALCGAAAQPVGAVIGQSASQPTATPDCITPNWHKQPVFGLARDLAAAADFLLIQHWQKLTAGLAAGAVPYGMFGQAEDAADALACLAESVVQSDGADQFDGFRKPEVSSGAASSYRKIAVWNTAFLGDALLTLPLIQTLRKAYPTAEIDFYTRKGFAPLFASNPALNAVYEYDKRKFASLPGMWRFGRSLRERGYDLFICAHPSTRSAILTRLSGAKRRIGYSQSSAKPGFGFLHHNIEAGAGSGQSGTDSDAKYEPGLLRNCAKTGTG